MQHHKLPDTQDLEKILSGKDNRKPARNNEWHSSLGIHLMNHPVYKLIHNHTSTQDYLQHVNGAKRKWLIGYDSYSLREKQEGSKLLSVDGWFIGETKQNIHEYRKVPDLTPTTRILTNLKCVLAVWLVHAGNNSLQIY